MTTPGLMPPIASRRTSSWRQLGDWVGLLPALAALGGATLLWTRSADRRLLRLTLGGAAIAAALFLRIQTPYIHHLYLIAPAIAAPIAASLMLVFASRPRAALAALAALGADHALAACGGAQSAGAGADRRAAAPAARRPRRTRAPQGLGRRARARGRQSLRPRLELYVQRPAASASCGNCIRSARPSSGRRPTSRCRTSTRSTGRPRRA